MRPTWADARRAPAVSEPRARATDTDRATSTRVNPRAKADQLGEADGPATGPAWG